jgi:hypothetical protein
MCIKHAYVIVSESYASLAWRGRGARPNTWKQLPLNVFAQVCEELNGIVALSPIEVHICSCVVRSSPDFYTLTPLELIARIAALIPSPRQHRHRYFSSGVTWWAHSPSLKLAFWRTSPNARQRGLVTPAAMSGAAITEGASTTQLAPADPAIRTDGNSARQFSRYSWAKLIARVYETDTLQCRRKVIYGITRLLANGE